MKTYIYTFRYSEACDLWWRGSLRSQGRAFRQVRVKSQPLHASSTHRICIPTNSQLLVGADQPPLVTKETPNGADRDPSPLHRILHLAQHLLQQSQHPAPQCLPLPPCFHPASNRASVCLSRARVGSSAPSSLRLTPRPACSCRYHSLLRSSCSRSSRRELHPASGTTGGRSSYTAR